MPGGTAEVGEPIEGAIECERVWPVDIGCDVDIES